MPPNRARLLRAVDIRVGDALVGPENPLPTSGSSGGGSAPSEVTLVGSNIQHAHAVTPDDDNDLAGVATYGPAQMLYVGGEGGVTITLAATGTVAFAMLAPGSWHPMPPFTRVMEASDATGIVAGY